MDALSRRRFLESLGGTAAVASFPSLASAATPHARLVTFSPPSQPTRELANGTTLTRLRVTGSDLTQAASRLAARGTVRPHPNAAGVLTLGVRESGNRTTEGLLAVAFTQALA